MKDKPYRYPLYLGLRLLQFITIWIPRPVGLALAEVIGHIAFWVARRERNKTIAHLTEVFKDEKSPEEIQKLAQNVFIHFAQVAVDVLRFPRLTPLDLDQLIEGRENLQILDRVLEQGRGAIVLTAHLGNWELMGAFLMLHGIKGAVIAKRIYYEKFNQILVNLRAKVKLKTFYQDTSPRQLLRMLRENYSLGILADQDVDRYEGIFVSFLGRPAYTLTTPVKLALASGAPLVPAFLVKTGDRYRFLVEEPIFIEAKANKDETVREYTQRWSQVVEDKIREFPDQWAWMHPRWKTVEESKEKAEPVFHD